MVDKCVKLDADTAIKRKGVMGTSDKDLLKKINELQDEKFTDIRSIRFGWVKQPKEDDPTKTEMKLMSSLPNGKYIFPDRTQIVEEIIPEDPYLCLVFEPKGQKVAFAKILFPEYQPKIFIPPTRIPAMVWRDGKGIIHRKVPHGNSYEERLIEAIKQMEDMKLETVKIIYRRNIRD